MKNFLVNWAAKVCLISGGFIAFGANSAIAQKRTPLDSIQNKIAMLAADSAALAPKYDAANAAINATTLKMDRVADSIRQTKIAKAELEKQLSETVAEIRKINTEIRKADEKITGLNQTSQQADSINQIKIAKAELEKQLADALTASRNINTAIEKATKEIEGLNARNRANVEKFTATAKNNSTTLFKYIDVCEDLRKARNEFAIIREKQ